MVRGEGGEAGPDFTNFGSREWVFGLLKNPKDKKYFKESGAMLPVKVPDESLLDMTEFLLNQSGGLLNQNTERLERGFDKFTDRELEALVQYLFTLSKDQVLISEKQEKGKRIYVFGLINPRAFPMCKGKS